MSLFSSLITFEQSNISHKNHNSNKKIRFRGPQGFLLLAAEVWFLIKLLNFFLKKRSNAKHQAFRLSVCLSVRLT